MSPRLTRRGLMQWAGVVGGAALLALTNSMNDNISALLLGRRPMSDYDQIVAEWRSNGGDQIRKEFMAALANG